MKHLLIAMFLLSSGPALALDPVTNRADFLSLVQGRVLAGDGVSLRVGPDGSISGRGFGLRVTGRWEWEGRYFCRTLDTALRDFPRNCQTVASDGAMVRFTADQGEGDTADLRLR